MLLTDSLWLPGSPDELEQSVSRLQKCVETISAKARLEPPQEYRLQLVLEEAVTNIILYGETEHGGGIGISLNIDSNKEVKVNIRDRGLRYDPFKQTPKPQLLQSLKERKVGGLGVHLIVKMVDDYEYVWRDGLNQTLLTLKPGSSKAKSRPK